MNCPFFLHAICPPSCEVLGENPRSSTRVLTPSLCKRGWDRFCPYWKYALKGFPVAVRQADWKPRPNPPVLHIGHVNRNGGYRSLTPDLI